MLSQEREMRYLERLKAEGKNSPADIFFTVDAGNLWRVQNEGFFSRLNQAT